MASLNHPKPYTFDDAEIALDLVFQLDAALPSPNERPPDDDALVIDE